LIVFVKFFQGEQEIFTKIYTRTMSITPLKQTILIHNFNFDEKTLVRFKKFIEKITKLHHFFQNQNQIETKKNSMTNLLFLNENRNQKSNSKFFI